MSINKESLTGREFRGVILPDKDPKQMGRYRVHIYGKMDHLPVNSGIWCKNHTHNSRITKSNRGTYGQYFPIQPGTEVIVKFTSNDFNSGYIDRIISDSSDKTQYKMSDFLDEEKQKKPESSPDRDDSYLLVKTPKYNNAIFINEDTEADSKNEIWISFNSKRTAIKISEDGIHIFTKDNQKVKIKVDENIEVTKNSSKKIGEDGVLNVENNYDIRVNGKTTISSEGDLKISTNGSMHLYSRREMILNSDSALILYPIPGLQKVINFTEAKEAKEVEDL